jgi:hypothetical protein
VFFSVVFKYILFFINRGVVTDEGESIVRRANIEKLKKTSFKFDAYSKPGYVLVFADPNAGGKNHMAIMGMAFVGGTKVVCIITHIHAYAYIAHPRVSVMCA